jgi:hypothetical protein
VRALGLSIALAFAWAAAAYGQLTADSRTVALWHLDDGVGTVALDASPQGFDFTLSRYPGDGSHSAQLPAWTAQGCSGGGVQLVRGDSTSYGSYLDSNHSQSFLANEFTVELMLRTATGNGILFWGGFLQLELSLDSEGKIHAYAGDGNTWSPVVIPDVAVDDGKWHHIASTYDGANVRVYIDGEPRASQPFTGVLGTISEFLAGGRGQNTFLDGTLDEIRLSDVARDGVEIAEDAATMRAFCPEPGAALAGIAGIGVLCGLRRRR